LLKLKSRSFKKAIVFASFVLPAAALYVFFILYPLLTTIIRSFFAWNVTRNIFHFDGFANYITIFTDDPGFRLSLLFTMRYAVVMVILINIVALLLAVGIESGIRGKGIVRNMFFIPNVMSGMIVAFVWAFIFTGLYPQIVQLIGVEFLQISWFATPTSAYWTVVIVSFWQALGFHVILYIAGLQVVPGEQYESASIDGASAFQKLHKITIPMIAPTITINLFLSIANSLRMFDASMALTRGGPLRTTESIAFNIYNTAFRQNDLGAASAKSVILLIIVCLITFLQLRLTSRKEVSL